MRQVHALEPGHFVRIHLDDINFANVSIDYVNFVNISSDNVKFVTDLILVEINGLLSDSTKPSLEPMC